MANWNGTFPGTVALVRRTVAGASRRCSRAADLHAVIGDVDDLVADFPRPELLSLPTTPDRVNVADRVVPAWVPSGATFEAAERGARSDVQHERAE